jgi:low temperature requirement protein LtrA
MAERFPLFIIILLGEVVVGVVNGLTEAEGGCTTELAGWLCLAIGFGIWWNYWTSSAAVSRSRAWACLGSGWWRTCLCQCRSRQPARAW